MIKNQSLQAVILNLLMRPLGGWDNKQGPKPGRIENGLEMNNFASSILMFQVTTKDTNLFKSVTELTLAFCYVLYQQVTQQEKGMESKEMFGFKC